MKPAWFTLALLLACWPVWETAGWMLELAGLAALGVVGRFVLLLLFLSGAEAVATRWLSVHAQP